MYCRGTHTRACAHTHKRTQSQPSCRHSDLAGSHRQWLHSSVLSPLHASSSFSWNNTGPLWAPRRKSKIYKRNTGDQWCCCILVNSTPLTGNQRSGHDSRSLLCSLVSVCVFVHAWDYVCVGICMCFSLRVFGGLFANVTVKPETDFLAFWSHMTAWSIIFSSTQSAIVFSCVGVSVTFITTHFLLILHSSVSTLIRLVPKFSLSNGVFLALFGYPIILSSRTIYLIITFAALLGIMC